MSRLLTLCSIVLSVLLARPAAAQHPEGISGVVSGIVQSGDSAAVPAASIALRRPIDTLVVAGSTTDSTGAFQLKGVAPGSYRVEVRRLGFRMQAEIARERYALKAMRGDFAGLGLDRGPGCAQRAFDAARSR